MPEAELVDKERLVPAASRSRRPVESECVGAVESDDADPSINDGPATCEVDDVVGLGLAELVLAGLRGEASDEAVVQIVGNVEVQPFDGLQSHPPVRRLAYMQTDHGAVVGQRGDRDVRRGARSTCPAFGDPESDALADRTHRDEATVEGTDILSNQLAGQSAVCRRITEDAHLGREVELPFGEVAGIRWLAHALGQAVSAPRK